MNVGDEVEVKDRKYAGARGVVSYVYPNPRHVRIKLHHGKTIERRADALKLLKAAQPST